MTVTYHSVPALPFLSEICATPSARQFSALGENPRENFINVHSALHLFQFTQNRRLFFTRQFSTLQPGWGSFSALNRRGGGLRWTQADTLMGRYFALMETYIPCQGNVFETYIYFEMMMEVVNFFFFFLEISLGLSVSTRHLCEGELV